MAGVWQERIKRASVTIRMLQQPRRSGLRVLQQGVRIPAAEQFASAGAAATALWRLICGATESPKKPFPDLGPLQQSMVVSNAARGSTGGVDEQSMVVSVANHASSDAPPGWGFTILQFQGGKIRTLNISKSDFTMMALPRNLSQNNHPTQVHKMRS